EDEGVSHVVFEASSLGLSTFRLDHCEIDVGLLLNIGTDHFDEHGGKENYVEAKKRLLYMADNIVVNGDDELCAKLTQSSNAPCVFFGTDSSADVYVLDEEGTLMLFAGSENKQMNFLLPGNYNRLNAAAAISALLVLG